MASQTRLQQLASTIAEKTALIHDALQAHDLATPSFEWDSKFYLPPEAEEARNVVLDATLELNDLLLHPMNLWQRKFAVSKSFLLFRSSQI